MNETGTKLPEPSAQPAPARDHPMNTHAPRLAPFICHRLCDNCHRLCDNRHSLSHNLARNALGPRCRPISVRGAAPARPGSRGDRPVTAAARWRVTVKRLTR